jgi:hypothetical protein
MGSTTCKHWWQVLEESPAQRVSKSSKVHFPAWSFPSLSVDSFTMVHYQCCPSRYLSTCCHQSWPVRWCPAPVDQFAIFWFFMSFSPLRNFKILPKMYRGCNPHSNNTLSIFSTELHSKSVLIESVGKCSLLTWSPHWHLLIPTLIFAITLKILLLFYDDFIYCMVVVRTFLHMGAKYCSRGSHVWIIFAVLNIPPLSSYTPEMWICKPRRFFIASVISSLMLPRLGTTALGPEHKCYS